jgi:subtilisin family serine protease
MHALVNLSPLMNLSSGAPEIVVGVIDGPVALALGQFAGTRTRVLDGQPGTHCARSDSVACVHGTLVSALLFAGRQSAFPGICPNCTLLVVPVFSDAPGIGDDMPLASQDAVASAIVSAIEAGARILNISAALTHPTSRSERRLVDALDFAAKRGVIVVAAAGNQRTFGSSPITRHPWVVPVAACEADGRPSEMSNLGVSIGRRGLLAPGAGVVAVASDERPRSFGGTSAAAPFVTGTIALLSSLFPRAAAARVLQAATQTRPRRNVVPPLLDAWAAYKALAI